MPMNDLGKIRRSQILFTAAPGAIVDFRTTKGPVSVVCLGLEQYPREGILIHEPRLTKQLRVAELRASPPYVEGRQAHALPALRFPRWLLCPNCDLLARDGWGSEPGEPALHCAACSARQARKTYVIPAPFVTACEKGHLDDFPWEIWVNHGVGCSQRDRYRLTNDGNAGLSGYVLCCLGCSERETMDGSFNRGPKNRFARCSGARPWLPESTAEAACTAERLTLQRGASNMYFPVILSALDIPPWSDALQQRLKRDWDRIITMEGDALRAFLMSIGLATQMEMSEDELFRQVVARKERLAHESDYDLRTDEYMQFTADADLAHDERGEFKIRRETVPAELQPWIGRLVRVLRLREVRVLRAFTRVRYPDPEVPGELPVWAKLTSSEHPQWLPAVEVRGEGIFVELNRARVKRWSDAYAQRCSKLRDAWVEDYKKRHDGKEPLRKIEPKTLLVHSLAHAVIRQLSVECGYSAASLRERLYVEGECCGFLVYTAAPDSDGTLGGLARQGRAERFRDVLANALESLRWCSSDPLCISDAHSFTENANGSACHSCLLVSETSCEEFNRLLDRQTIVGSLDNPSLAYFFGSELL